MRHRRGDPHEREARVGPFLQNRQPWQEQHEGLDTAFGGAAHRTAIAHFLWGDRVLSSGPEDLVLTARRGDRLELLATELRGAHQVKVDCVALDLTTPDAALPETVRAMVEKAVDQSREVYDRSKDALDASVTTLERTFDAAGQGAVAFNRKMIDIAQRNVNSGFDLAKSLAGAKNLSEMVELQAAYWQKLLGALTSQAEEVRALSTKMAAAAGEPLKQQMKRGVDDLRKSN